MAPLLTVVLALVSSLTVVGAQDSGSVKSALPVMTGLITQVSPDLVTINVGGNAVTFQIDKSTSVSRIGGTHKNDLLNRHPDRPATLVDFIKVGDRVAVRYRQFADALLAVELRVSQK